MGLSDTGAGLMRTVLIISPYFPPSTLAGVHRARHLAKHLPAHGWTPVVVRVDARFYTEAGDPALAGLVPGTVEQRRTTALPAGLTKLIGGSDLGLRAYHGIATAVGALSAERRIDAVLITGSPFYPMLLGRWIKRRLGLPVVLDFQDPWVSAQGAQRPFWSKGRFSYRLARLLEPRAVRSADFVTSVSDTQNAQMAARYPWLWPARMAAIPIGGDPEDFDALRAALPGGAGRRLDPGRINLSYVGTFLPRAAPLVRQVFQALAALRSERPGLANRLMLNFVGTSNQPGDRGEKPVTRLAADEGVADLVSETPGRVPYLEALGVLANSDGLLLIGSDEPHYTASKIYPALMSGRPYLSLFHAASSAHDILGRAGGGVALAFSSAAELTALKPRLADALVTLAEHPETLGAADPAAYAPYTARSVAGRFAEIFNQAARP